MTEFTLSRTARVPANALWRLVGPFGHLARFDPSIERLDLDPGGTVRRLTMKGGGEIVEQLLLFDDSTRTLRWRHLEIIGLDLPLSNLTATLRVIEDGPATSLIEASCRYTPAPAADAAELEKIMTADFATLAETACAKAAANG